MVLGQEVQESERVTLLLVKTICHSGLEVLESETLQPEKIALQKDLQQLRLPNLKPILAEERFPECQHHLDSRRNPTWIEQQPPGYCR
jgi:hypothetical protein